VNTKSFYSTITIQLASRLLHSGSPKNGKLLACMHLSSSISSCYEHGNVALLTSHHIAGEGSLVGDFVDPQLGCYGGENLI
jgi:hypothetical protein